MPTSVDTNQTQFNVNVVKSEAVFEEMKKAGLPPRQIFMTPDVAGNVDNLRTEVIYDKSSLDTSKNWGYTGGIQGGVTVTGKDFSKYDKLIITSYQLGLILTLIYDMQNHGYEQSIAGTSADLKVEMNLKCNVLNDKTAFNVTAIGYYNGGWVDRNSNVSYVVTKIEGILKNPSAIYTGFGLDELLDRFYPVGSIYTSIENVSPASTLGGTWTQIANNVVLPLGNYANVDTLPAEHSVTGYGLKNQLKKAQTLGFDTSGMFYSTDGLPSGSGYNNPVFTNLYADLATATNAISGIYMWKRIS